MIRIVQGAREALAMAKGEANPNDHAVNISMAKVSMVDSGSLSVIPASTVH